MQKLLSIQNHLTFITGGHAIFTVRNTNTGNRFTYSVTVPKDRKPEDTPVWFVRVLTGGDNTKDYRYIGILRRNPVTGLFAFFYGLKSKVTSGAPSVVAFDYVFNKLVAHGFTKPNLEIWHEGKCCRCGRRLTVPESIESGIGPECGKIRVESRDFKNS